MKNSIKKIILAAFILGSILSINPSYLAYANDFSKEDYELAKSGCKDLIGARLEGADLRGVDLSCADLRGAELEEADLRGANLTGANLKNADLEKANLKGAIIDGAVFKGADLDYTIWVNGRVCAEGSVGSCR